MDVKKCDLCGREITGPYREFEESHYDSGGGYIESKGWRLEACIDCARKLDKLIPNLGRWKKGL